MEFKGLLIELNMSVFCLNDIHTRMKSEVTTYFLQYPLQIQLWTMDTALLHISPNHHLMMDSSLSGPD